MEIDKDFAFLCARSIEGTVRSSTTSDADMKLINRYSLTPLERDDVTIVSMDLVNDRVDRHFSRFPEREIKRIASMIKGKPLMVNHDMPGMFSSGSLPRGTFYKGEFIKDAGGAKAVGDAYILRSRRNDDFVQQIKGGVYRGTSVSFAFERAECSICHTDLRECAHWPGRKYAGEQCHYVMHDVYDVFEQSIVPLGSQGTEVLGVRSATFMQDTFLNALRDAGKPEDAMENEASEKISLQNDADALDSAPSGEKSVSEIQAGIEAKLKSAMERDISAGGR